MRSITLTTCSCSKKRSPVQVTKWEFPLQLYRAHNTQMSNIKRANTALSIRRGAPCARVLAGRARPTIGGLCRHSHSNERPPRPLRSGGGNLGVSTYGIRRQPRPVHPALLFVADARPKARPAAVTKDITQSVLCVLHETRRVEWKALLEGQTV